MDPEYLRMVMVGRSTITERLVEHVQGVVEINEKIRSRIEKETGLLVLNPYRYAWKYHERWLREYSPRKRGALLVVALNPGPYGAVQTGIPFTDVRTARSKLPKVGFDLDLPGMAPKILWPKLVLTYERSSLVVYTLMEWGWGSVEEFYKDAFVFPYSPLFFADLSRRSFNVTPEDSRLRNRPEIEEAFRFNFQGLLEIFRPRGVLALGKLASERVLRVSPPSVPVVSAPHPARSPPLRWSEEVTIALRNSGLLPSPRL